MRVSISGILVSAFMLAVACAPEHKRDCRWDGPGLITQATPAEQRCRLEQARRLDRITGGAREVAIRAALWDREGSPPGALVRAARGKSRTQVVLALAEAGGVEPLAGWRGFGCFMPYTMARPVYDAADPDARSADCRRLLAAAPSRRRFAEIAATLDWDGVCPSLDDLADGRRSRLPAGYAALAGDREAAACLGAQDYHREETEAFWALLHEALSGPPADVAVNAQMEAELRALITRIDSGGLTDFADVRRIEDYLV